jgi:hypothetical protein
MDARLALRTAEERARALAGRAEQLERAAAAERDARAKAVQRQERRHRQMLTAAAVHAGARYVLEVLEARWPRPTPRASPPRSSAPSGTESSPPSASASTS